jgi:hypothetical protein
MSEFGSEPAKAIAPKDVFQRSNMPSRWERLTGVSPKMPTDRMFLAWGAARYRGDERLPLPAELDSPRELTTLSWARTAGWSVCAIGGIMAAVGWSADVAGLLVAGAVVAVAALLVILAFSVTNARPIRSFRELQQRSEAAEARLHADRLDPEDAATLSEMITCDEGTLTYCAAKIAAEIERDLGWESDSLGFVAIDLREEVADIAASARQIAEDRRAIEALERGHLRTDPEVRDAIHEGKQQRSTALGLLAARVHAFADYRDRVQLHGLAAHRERSEVNRAVRMAIDEQARDRLR